MTATPIANAAIWLQQLMFGPAMIAVATIAIGWLGIRLFSGRLELRRGLTTILGVFILFGAPTLALAFISLGNSNSSAPAIRVAPPERAPPSPPEPASDISPYARPSLYRD